MAPATPPEHDRLVPITDLTTTDMEEVTAVAPKIRMRGTTLIATVMFGVATYIAATRTSFSKESARVQAQLETVELDACSAPAESFSLPHKGCPIDNLDSSCVASNQHYSTFAEAWAACGTVSECGLIMRWMDGTFYLRRNSDPNYPIAGVWSMLYSCVVEQAKGKTVTAENDAEQSTGNTVNAEDDVEQSKWKTAAVEDTVEMVKTEEVGRFGTIKVIKSGWYNVTFHDGHDPVTRWFHPGDFEKIG